MAESKGCAKLLRSVTRAGAVSSCRSLGGCGEGETCGLAMNLKIVHPAAWAHYSPRETALPRSYFFAFATEAALSAYFFWKRSTRPAVSISFCLPVKNGWQFEQISTRIRSPLWVERV